MQIGRGDCLLVIDYQFDFVDPNGKLYVKGSEKLFDGIVSVLSTFHYSDAFVIMTQDIHPEKHISFASTHGQKPFTKKMINGVEETLWPDHCVTCGIGPEFYCYGDSDYANMIFRKGLDTNVDSYSAFENNNGEKSQLYNFIANNNEFKRLFFCGVALDYCVSQSILKAPNNVERFLISNLTASVNPENNNNVIKTLVNEGVSICTFDVERKNL